MQPLTDLDLLKTIKPAIRKESDPIPSQSYSDVDHQKSKNLTSESISCLSDLTRADTNQATDRPSSSQTQQLPSNNKSKDSSSNSTPIERVTDTKQQTSQQIKDLQATPQLTKQTSLPLPTKVALNRKSFTPGQVVGRGAYGVVYKVQFQDAQMLGKAVPQLASQPQTFFGLKEMVPRAFQADGRIKEVFIEKTVLTYFDHPGITKMYQSFGAEGKLYLLLEYLPYGSLDTYLERIDGNKLPPPQCKRIAAELVDCLGYLASKQVVHRDLKPGNILLDGNLKIKLCDFATCKVYNEQINEAIVQAQAKMQALFRNQADEDTSRNFSLVGTEEYMAPETLNDTDACYASDLWSFGVILYQLLTGSTPFKGRTQLQTYKNIKEKDITMQLKELEDKQAADLINRLLQKEPQDRIGALNIDDVMKHPYFKEIDFTSLHIDTKQANQLTQSNDNQQDQLTPLMLRKTQSSRNVSANIAIPSTPQNNKSKRPLYQHNNNDASKSPNTHKTNDCQLCEEHKHNCDLPTIILEDKLNNPNPLRASVNLCPVEQFSNGSPNAVKLSIGKKFFSSAQIRQQSPSDNSPIRAKTEVTAFFGGSVIHQQQQDQPDYQQSPQFGQQQNLLKQQKKSEQIIIQGVLRKKGMLLHTERIVKLTSEGQLSYTRKQNAMDTKLVLNLRDAAAVKFFYNGRRRSATANSANTLPMPCGDDDFKIYMQGETFVFRDADMGDKQPRIQDWERAFRSLSRDKISSIFTH